MNKTLAITTIALVAVVMGMSAVVPAMAAVKGTCDGPLARAIMVQFRGADIRLVEVDIGSGVDRNENGFICEVTLSGEARTSAIAVFDDHIIPAFQVKR